MTPEVTARSGELATEFPRSRVRYFYLPGGGDAGLGRLRTHVRLFDLPEDRNQWLADCGRAGFGELAAAHAADNDDMSAKGGPAKA